MFIKNHPHNNLHVFSLPYTDALFVDMMSEKMISWFPDLPREYVIACIGSDRSTGDSLGPLIGTFLSEMKPKHMTIYGTLHEPIHSLNLNDYIHKINIQHRNPYVIAIDACLGKSSSVGNISIANHPLKPGLALNKDLPEIGNMNIAGIVNVGGFMEYTVLQNTKLSLVIDLARTIVALLSIVDQRLTFRRSQPAVISK